MNQNTNFSEFTNKMVTIIKNGKDAQEANKASLEGMRLQALLQERHEDAESIDWFLKTAKNELSFFRAAANASPSASVNSQKPLARKLRFWKKDNPNRSNFIGLADHLSPENPFALVEGLFIETGDNKQDADLKTVRTPFFAAIALNTSEATTLGRDNLVCLFNRAGKEFELRLWEMSKFAQHLSGNSYDQAVLNLPPDANETIVRRSTGSMAKIFQTAVERMTTAALSKDPREDVAKRWIELITQYGTTQPIAALE